jgi:beta-lactamase class A
MKRRGMLILSGLLLAQAAWASPPSCDLGGEFQKIVYEKIGQARAMSDTSFGLAVIEHSTGAVLCQEFVQPEQDIYPASTIKTLVAVALLRRVDHGELSLDQEMTIDQPNAGAECRHWNCKVYGPGKSVTLGKLLFDMITVSNNIAANQLIDAATKAFINETASDLGTPGLQVFRKVYEDVDPEPEIKERNRSNASGFVELYREIDTGRQGILSEKSRALLIDILGQQKINGSLNRNFPKSVKFFHKTGNTSKVTGDGGFYPLDGERDVLLVGLQNFTKFQICSRLSGRCTKRTGFESLGLVGKAALELTQRLKR